MEIMQHLNQETDTAFLFATHDPRVMAFARRMVKLQDGRVVENGSGNNGLKGNEGVSVQLPG